ncbi:MULTISPECIES: hypothetical protein [Aerosakkonema]|uniref:hypothetical protein n=1 Tax=Aerosakkonema TaxID=1246629 RepID=UPI0035BC490E
MQNIRPRSIIRPKISSMPRNKSEASKQLELYKLVTEQQRIQQEMVFMEQRMQQLKQRLTVLDNQIFSTKQTIEELHPVVPSNPKVRACPPIVTEFSNFQNFYLEY